MGTKDDGWVTKLQTLPDDDGGDPQFKIYSPNQIYVFSIYWVFTVLTTVGYGDYNGQTSEEFIFTIFIEFGGISFFAMMTIMIKQLA